MIIREAKPEDLPGITVVRTSVEENHLSVQQMAERGITEQVVIRDMQSGDLGAWVAVIEGRIVGFAMSRKSNSNLFALFMLPGFERRGCGSQLLAVAEDWLRAQGCNAINLDTDENSYAKNFYLNHGYQLKHRADGEVHLTKTL